MTHESPTATNQEKMGGLKGIGLRNSRRHRFGSRRYFAGMPKQPREGGPANTVGQQNSKSERGERRANQHQRIDCILHSLIHSPFELGAFTSGSWMQPRGQHPH